MNYYGFFHLFLENNPKKVQINSIKKYDLSVKAMRIFQKMRWKKCILRIKN